MLHFDYAIPSLFYLFHSLIKVFFPHSYLLTHISLFIYKFVQSILIIDIFFLQLLPSLCQHYIPAHPTSCLLVLKHIMSNFCCPYIVEYGYAVIHRSMVYLLVFIFFKIPNSPSIRSL